MRWPFGHLFGHHDDKDAAETASVGNGIAAPVVPSPNTSPATRGEWAALPPIQRVAGAAPLVAPTAPFQAEIQARESATLALAPLNHAVSRLAEPGLVAGLATPVVEPIASGTPVVAGPDLTLRPAVQRRPAVDVVARSVVDVAVPPDPAAPRSEPAASRAALEPVAAPPVVQLLPIDPEPLTRAAALPNGATAPAGILTLVPSSTAARSVQRAADADRSVPVETPPVETQPTAFGMREPASVDHGPPQPPGVQRLTVGQGRRLGLGAPLARLPLAAQRAATGPESTPPDPAGVGHAPATLPASAPVAHPAVVVNEPMINVAVAMAPAPADHGQLALASLQRSPLAAANTRPDDLDAATVQPMATEPPEPPSSFQREVNPPQAATWTPVLDADGPPSIDAAGALPLPTARRAPGSPLDGAPAVSRVAPVAQRDLDRGLAPVSLALRSRPANGGATRPEGRGIQRMAAEASAVPGGTPAPGRALVGSDERRLAVTVPGEAPVVLRIAGAAGIGLEPAAGTSASPQPAEAPSVIQARTSAGAADAAPVVQWSALPTIQRLAPGTGRPLPPSRPGPAVAALQRAPAGEGKAVAWGARPDDSPAATPSPSTPAAAAVAPAVQLLGDDVAAGPPAPSVSPEVPWPTIQRATAAPGLGTAGDPEQQLDDLASKLYGRLRSRLATELLLDRERAGMLMDAP